jgi:hypothetical protein
MNSRALSVFIRGPLDPPPKLFVCGVPGIGKTTLGHCAIRRVLIRCEHERLSTAPRFPSAARDFDVVAVRGGLRQNQHDYHTAGLDALTFLRKFIL